MRKIFNTVGVVSILVVLMSVAVGVAFAQGENPPAPPSPFDWGAISKALQDLALLVIPALAAFVARWLNAKYHNERAKLNETQVYLLDSFINVAVYAAEQLKVTNAIDNKLDYVTILVQTWLNARGLTMDVAEIRARIEAAVKQEFPKTPPLPEG